MIRISGRRLESCFHRFRFQSGDEVVVTLIFFIKQRSIHQLSFLVHFPIHVFPDFQPVIFSEKAHQNRVERPIFSLCRMVPSSKFVENREKLELIVEKSFHKRFWEKHQVFWQSRIYIFGNWIDIKIFCLFLISQPAEFYEIHFQFLCLTL